MKKLSRILIVEDDYIQSYIIKIMLESLKYNVVGIAETGENAITMAGELKPDLVLIDIMLNGELDGIDAAKKILESSGISVIYVTGGSIPYYKKRASQTNYVDILSKPFDREGLAAALDKYYVSFSQAP